MQHPQSSDATLLWPEWAEEEFQLEHGGFQVKVEDSVELADTFCTRKSGASCCHNHCALAGGLPGANAALPPSSALPVHVIFVPVQAVAQVSVRDAWERLCAQSL